MASQALHITNNTIKYGDRVYAVHNITQIDVLTCKRAAKVRWRVILGCGFVLWLCIYYPYLLAQFYQYIVGTPLRRDWFGLFFIVLFVVFGYGLWDRTRLKFYTLLIETSGRTASLFSSRDWHIIRDVADKIFQAMEDRSSALSYHVNIGDVINTSGTGNKVISRTTMGDLGGSG
jgi:hypothetical protein